MPELSGVIHFSQPFFKVSDSFFQNTEYTEEVKKEIISNNFKIIASRHSNLKDVGIVTSKDKARTLAYFGEILDGNTTFNWQKLVDLSDDQLLKTIVSLNGQFCIILITRESSYLISDRFCTHPIYYCLQDNQLLFSINAAKLYEAANEKKLNKQTISNLFAFGHNVGEGTLLENVKSLPPASILSFTNQSLKLNRYWEFSYKNQYEQNKHTKNEMLDFSKTIIDGFKEAAIKQAKNEENYLIPLSGGLDSRYLVALYHSLNKHNFKTFTMGSENSEDFIYANQVKNILKLDHKNFTIDANKIWNHAQAFNKISGGIFPIHAPLQTFQVYENYENQAEIVCASQMTDTLTGGTLWRKKIQSLTNPNPSESYLLDIYLQNSLSFCKEIFNDNFKEEFNHLPERITNTYQQKVFHPLHNYFSFLINQRARHATFSGNLVALQSFSMRMISFDYSLFDLLWEIPVSAKKNQTIYRLAFTHEFPDLAKVPRQGFNLPIDCSDTSYQLKIFLNKIETTVQSNKKFTPLRKLLFRKKKESYVSHKEWINTIWNTQIHSIFSNRKEPIFQVVNYNTVNNILNYHQTGKANHTNIIWQLLNLNYSLKNLQN